MLDNKDFQIPEGVNACLISMVNHNLKGHETSEETERSLKELKELLRTLGIDSVHQDYQTKKQMDAATILGKGKLLEIASVAKEKKAEILVFDFELSASQVRNIQKITDFEVIDRCSVILDIFAKHARTKEAKIQIEIARLQYLLPRLTNFWSHLDRQKGGVGVRSGEGEQQLELDRRIVRRKLEAYKRKVKDIEVVRKEQRKKRQNQAVTAALVGYTNAGKSSIMNRLCKVELLEEDKLFATLDASYRMLNPDTKPPMILIDTVGFISNLPNTLIEGFKTTLESAIEADLLILVVDISDPNFTKHIEVTFEVLKELGIDTENVLTVFNKKDQVEDMLTAKVFASKYTPHFFVSSYDDQDMDELREYVLNHFLDKQEHLDLFVPYEQGHIHSKIEGQTNVIKRENFEKGIFYRVKAPSFIFERLNLRGYMFKENQTLT